MTQEVPKLDVQTLEYVVSMLDAEKEAYRDRFYKAVDTVIQNRYRAIFSHMISLKKEITDLIEEQREGGE